MQLYHSLVCIMFSLRLPCVKKEGALPMLLDLYNEFLNLCIEVSFYLFNVTMIDKQVIQLILICLVGTDDSAMGSLMWEKTGVPGEDNVSKQATTILFHIQHLPTTRF